jgi:hypothetical protein
MQLFQGEVPEHILHIASGDEILHDARKCAAGVPAAKWALEIGELDEHQQCPGVAEARSANYGCRQSISGQVLNGYGRLGGRGGG